MQNKSQEDIILHFRGDLNYDVIGELIGSLKDAMKSREVRFGLYKKMLTLLIESLENIVRYNFSIASLIPKDIIDNPPELWIVEEAGEYSLSASNLIRNEDIEALDNRISLLNSLDKDKLKDLYKETITDGKFSEKGGAGLGIIEMAKIIDSPIDYTFSRLNDKLSVFRLHLHIKISNEKQA